MVRHYKSHIWKVVIHFATAGWRTDTRIEITGPRRVDVIRMAQELCAGTRIRRLDYCNLDKKVHGAWQPQKFHWPPLGLKS